MKIIPKIAVIGKPNVGKSTLINRLCNHSEAIVHHESMITRDRKYYKTDWGGLNFNILDTGGIDLSGNQKLSSQILQQSKKAIEESDIIIFVVDIKEPITILDHDVAGILRKTKKPVIFVGNKWDNPSAREDAYFIEDYLVLGFGYPIAVSAIQGLNITDLLDEIVKKIKDLNIDFTDGYESVDDYRINLKKHKKSTKNDIKSSPEETQEIPTIAILGQPNVGKSTLFNNIIKEERVIVDELEGTTRDSIDSIITISGKQYKFIDTAGLKKDRVREEDLEFYSKIRTFRSIENSDVCIILIDCTREITNQDRKIVEKCLSKGKSVCVIFNKTDIVTKEKIEELIYDFNTDLEFLDFVPFLKISALKQKNIKEIFKMIDYLLEERNKEISESRLTNHFKRIEDQSGIYLKGRKFKIKFIRQLKTSPPCFLVFSNMSINKKNNVVKFIENNIREEFGFTGTPIFLKFK